MDTNFSGGWDKENPDDPDNVLSRTGFVVFYAGYPLVWASRMQTKIELFTAESKYIALSMAMQEVLSLKQSMEEVHKIFEIKRLKPKIHCKDFEHNESCISMAKRKEFSHRTLSTSGSNTIIFDHMWELQLAFILLIQSNRRLTSSQNR